MTLTKYSADSHVTLEAERVKVDINYFGYLEITEEWIKFESFTLKI